MAHARGLEGGCLVALKPPMAPAAKRRATRALRGRRGRGGAPGPAARRPASTKLPPFGDETTILRRRKTIRLNKYMTDPLFRLFQSCIRYCIYFSF